MRSIMPRWCFSVINEFLFFCRLNFLSFEMCRLLEEAESQSWKNQSWSFALVVYKHLLKWVDLQNKKETMSMYCNAQDRFHTFFLIFRSVKRLCLISDMPYTIMTWWDHLWNAGKRTSLGIRFLISKCVPVFTNFKN